jgi:hypothetical protein
VNLHGAICSLSCEDGFVWDRGLVAEMSPEEIRELAALKRQELADFAREDAERGMPWGEARIAEISAQIDVFEKLES